MGAAFVMAGGGTGGHVMPALAVARELKERGHDVHFIGTQKGLEAKLVTAASFPIDWIEVGGLNRVGWRQMVMTLAELPLSIIQASRFLDRIRPKAVFSTGGYVAGPVLLAALAKRVPLVVMEPNAIPGFTHRRLARFVARALVCFPETARWFPKGRAEVTGMPVRRECFELAAKARTAQTTILITGGSQGSRTLNRAAEESWPLWRKGTVRLMHQTGMRAYEEMAPKFHASGVAGEIVPFFDDIVEAYGGADLVVSRAGMGTLSELAAAGKPAVLVPLPTAANQHQLRNAEAFAKAGAARLVPDNEMSGPRLVAEVASMTGDLEAMSQKVRVFARPGAAKRAAEVLEAYAAP